MRSKLSILLNRKELIVVFAVLVIAVGLIALAFELARGQSPRVTEPPPSKYDAHLLELDKAALDQAYSKQLELLFSVWLKDDIKATHRVTNGLRTARHAYVAAIAEIEKREQKLK